ncbi:MAG: LysR family transcriptional regulator [Zoogloeaceae bacterium]|nr:LysR family transcriptional regulator [Zoogloeaceae bacterium]
MSGLDSWESFVRVVEEGSMAGAARRLDCTRARISKHIAALESAFGVRLFERSTRRLMLTPAGEAFYPHAKGALESVAGAELAVRNLGDAPRGVLRVSATSSFGRRYVAPLLPALAEQYPELECELILTDRVVDLVEDRIDLALRLTRAPPEEAIARPLATLDRRICGAVSYLARRGVPRTPQELAQHDCFSYLMADGGVWRLAKPDGEVAVSVKSRFRVNDVEAMFDAVCEGHGLAILSSYLTAEGLAEGRLATVLDEWEPLVPFGRTLYACYTPGRARTPKVRVFLAALEALLQPVPPWRQTNA